ncbi:MAG: lipopolysaccharide assembly protein LapA domain-containing protein [Pseudomonadales bacterium]
MNAIRKLLWAVLAIAVFGFALLAVNQGQIALRFLRWETPEVSVFWWLLAAFLLGAGFTAIGCGITSMRLRVRQRSLNKQLDESRRQLELTRSQS